MSDDNSAPDLQPSMLLRRRDDLAAVVVDGETILYDPVTEMLHHLDPIATLIWERLDGLTSLEAISGSLSQMSDTVVEVVRRDILSLAGQLHSDGLLEMAEEP